VSLSRCSSRCQQLNPDNNYDDDNKSINLIQDYSDDYPYVDIVY
jgi:hypothetical protein